MEKKLNCHTRMRRIKLKRERLKEGLCVTDTVVFKSFKNPIACLFSFLLSSTKNVK